MAKLVSKTYGDALFEVASEENRLDEFLDAAVVMQEVLQENDDFVKLLCHPKMAKEDKVKMVEESFGESMPKELTGLIVLMVQKGRETEVLSTLSYFAELIKKKKKIGKAEITTAIPLSEKQKERIEQKLLTTTEYQTFEMQYQIDESLIGGMTLRVDDRVVDSSIRTKLDNLSRELRKVQV